MVSDPFEEVRDTLRDLHRNRPERRLAGVCAALADRLEVPLPLVRAGFLLGALVPATSALAILLYGALWFLTPAELQGESAFDRLLDIVRDLFGMDDEPPPRRPLSSDELPTDPSV
jgi:phage shock protein PspC (stress-responsive transcriptional regulator)